MHRFRMTLGEARERDRLLYDLSFYDVTNGKIVFIENDIDELYDLGKEVVKRFNKYKVAIQNGEYTLEELENIIVSRNAAILSPKVGRTVDEIDKFVEEFDEEEIQRKEVLEQTKDLFGGIIDNLLSGESLSIPLNKKKDLNYEKEELKKKRPRKEDPKDEEE